MELPAYSRRHLDPALAAAYSDKFRRSYLRRLSSLRESRLVWRALARGFDWHLQRGRQPSELVLLDCPCGAGRFAPMAASQVGGYIAGDHSPHMLALTAAVLEGAGLANRLRGSVEGDARTLELPDGSADIGMCMRLLHHFDQRGDRIRILERFARIVDGPLVTSFLDADSWKQRRHVARLARSGRKSRRVLVSPQAFAAEAAEAGWQLVASWPLSGLFSGQRIALCLPVAESDCGSRAGGS